MLTTYNNVAIKGIVTAMPKYVDECDQELYTEIMGAKKLKRHIKLTGIKRRRLVMNEQKTSDLAIEAVRELLSKTGWREDSVDILILVTQSQDMLLPATSMFVHKEFAFKKDMVVFDINLGCSGYVTGLQVVANLLQGNARRAILLSGDIWKKSGEWDECISDWMLFGSAITASALEKEKDKVLFGMQYVDGKGALDIKREFGHVTRMKGDAVFSFAINEVVDGIRGFMHDFQISDQDVDYYIFHQAQKMILDNLMDILGIAEEKMLTSYEDYGNTSSASIPLTLDIQSEKFVKGARVLLCGFGVGLAWSAVYTTIEPGTKMSVVETDYVIQQD